MKETVFTSLESQRLRLRRFVEADLPPFLAYLNDPLVARYQTWESYTEQQARDVIQKQQNLVPGVPGQWFTFAVELKAAGVLIGHVALKMEDHQQAEIGFTFSRAHQGQGLASEAATCVLNYAFTKLELHRVIAITDCENERSVALLNRLGMRREGHFIQNIWFKGKWEMNTCMQFCGKSGYASAPSYNLLNPTARSSLSSSCGRFPTCVLLAPGRVIPGVRHLVEMK